MPRAPAQASFLISPSFAAENRIEHGAQLRLGRRKLFRPIDPRKPLHLVLRSSRAKGDWSMLAVRHEKRVKHLVHWAAKRHGTRVFRFANAGNHIHLVVYGSSRKSVQDYLRTLSGMIARAVTGAKKGVSKGRFWDGLAYSKVITWGRQLRNLNFYVIMNEMEGLGIWSRDWKSVRRPGMSGQNAPP